MRKKKRGITGRPPFFDSPEKMQEKIDAYFKKCEGAPLYSQDGEPVLDKYNNLITVNRKPPTITGLALALGFTTRQSLLDYQAKPAFVDTVTRAKSRVEAYTEERLFDRDGVNGAKFSLINNFRGWSESPKDDQAEQLERINDNIENLAELINHPVADRGLHDE